MIEVRYECLGSNTERPVPEGRSIIQSQRYLSSKLADAASETLGIPVEKFGSDGVPPDLDVTNGFWQSR